MNSITFIDIVQRLNAAQEAFDAYLRIWAEPIHFPSIDQDEGPRRREDGYQVGEGARLWNFLSRCIVTLDQRCAGSLLEELPGRAGGIRRHDIEHFQAIWSTFGFDDIEDIKTIVFLTTSEDGQFYNPTVSCIVLTSYLDLTDDVDRDRFQAQRPIPNHHTFPHINPRLLSIRANRDGVDGAADGDQLQNQAPIPDRYTFLGNHSGLLSIGTNRNDNMAVYLRVGKRGLTVPGYHLPPGPSPLTLFCDKNRQRLAEENLNIVWHPHLELQKFPGERVRWKEASRKKYCSWVIKSK